MKFHEIKQAALKGAQFKPRDVPEWGGTVQLRKLGAQQYVALQAAHEGIERDEKGDPKQLGDLIGWACDVLQAGLFDDEGGHIFTTPEARDWLASQPLDLLMDLSEEIFAHSGLVAPTVAAAKASGGKAPKKKKLPTPGDSVSS